VCVGGVYFTAQPVVDLIVIAVIEGNGVGIADIVSQLLQPIFPRTFLPDKYSVLELIRATRSNIAWEKNVTLGTKNEKDFVTCNDANV